MSTQIAVRLPDDLVTKLDAWVAEGAYDSRAAAVRAGLEALDALRARIRLEAAIEDGYRRHPPTDAEERAALASLREAIAEEPW